MLIDCFTLFNEFDLLEFRLKLLWDKVDRFVIVEADRTFSGLEKPFNFELQMQRFEWAREKIVYYPLHVNTDGIDLNSKPTKYDPNHDCWKIEYQQRNAIKDACTNFADDAIVLMGDVDEIPSLDAIMLAKMQKDNLPLVCRQAFFYYNLKNLRHEIWDGTVIATLGLLRQHGAQTLRHSRGAMPVIEGGGWHLSYLGGKEKIQEKIRSFSHQEYNIPEFTDEAHIENCVNSGDDLFKRNVKISHVGEHFFPLYFVKKARVAGLM